MIEYWQDSYKSVGEDVTIYPLAKIISPEVISLGNHIVIDDFVFIGKHLALFIGNHIHIASFTSITGGGEAFLEDYVCISSGIRLFSGTEDPYLLNNPTIPDEFRGVRRSFIRLGKYVFVGANAIVLPDNDIPEGTIIGAGALVLADSTLEPWSVYVGVPVKKIGTRPKRPVLEAQARLEESEGKA